MPALVTLTQQIAGVILFRALSDPPHGSHAHVEGISNPSYQALWEQMLGVQN